MKKSFLLATALVMAGGLSLAYAGNVEKGKALFESPTLGGGTTGKSCQSCHPDGKRLGSDLFERKHLRLMGYAKTNVAEVVNSCIEKPLGGKAIDPNGEEMQDLLAYMQTLTAKQAKPKKMGGMEGC
jgi:mono/diheme cytochrome c family protein